MSSGSRSLVKKRKVLPRIYSLGCWRSLRIPLLHLVSTFLVSLFYSNQPNQYHFLFQLAPCVKLRTYFIIEIK